MKIKKRLLVVIILSLSMVFLVFSCYFFPRLFANTEIKTMYKIKSILNSYIDFKSDDLIDFIDHTFNAGDYKYENDELQLTLGVQTSTDIIDLVSKASILCDEIKTYINSNSNFNGKKVDITLRIEHWAEWVVILVPNSNHIIIGLGDQMSITQILSYCKEFEIINIGGYWGNDVSIPDDIEKNFFVDFNALKALKISDIKTPEMEKHLNEVVTDLRENGTDVVTEVHQS